MREERAEYLDRLIFLYVLIAPEEIPGLFYVVILTLLVTVHSVHSNTLRDAQKSCIRMIRAAILGFSVNFVHKKHLAERYQ